MPIIRIDDPDDARVTAYRDIRERDLVGRQGRFVAEGSVVLRALLASPRFSAESVLVLENRLSGIDDLLAEAPPDLPVYVAGRDVIDAVAGFPMHRGVVAIGRRGAVPGLAALVAGLPPHALVVAAVGIANHDNVGAIFRNAAAFGVDAIVLDGESCDPLYRKAIRVSTGAALALPFAREDNAMSIVRTLASAGFRQLALSPAGATPIRQVVRSERMAIYLGTEGEGLPAGLMAELETVRIPMVPGFDSLNVATASAIALHELAQLR
ncbi:MAG: RNA methyltransferase [Rhizobiaceae bacterium]|nr:RNA methyltransferase [Rhizobiaceae bacterium]